MRILTPDLYLENVCAVTASLLAKRGIKALILDVDNTLAEHNSQFISKEVLQWVDLMKQSGIQMMIASNNNAARIHPFAEKIGLEAIPNSMKPLPKGYRKAQEIWGLASSEIAVVGDQIYTDIVGANLSGMFSIMVQRISVEKNLFFHLKRFFERPVLWRYRKIGPKPLLEGESK